MGGLNERTTGEEAEYMFKKQTMLVSSGSTCVAVAPRDDELQHRKRGTTIKRNVQHHSATPASSTESELRSASTHHWAHLPAKAKPPIFHVSPRSDLLASGSALQMQDERKSLRRTDGKA